MTDDHVLIDLCERLGWALDINYVRGTVIMRNRKYVNIAQALAEAQRVDLMIKSF